MALQVMWMASTKSMALVIRKSLRKSMSMKSLVIGVGYPWTKLALMVNMMVIAATLVTGTSTVDA